MKQLQVYKDATLHHTNAKIIVFFIICILLGVLLSILIPDFGDDDKINRTRRTRPAPTRVVLRQMRLSRTVRRKTA
jgi:hypothetical protein